MDSVQTQPQNDRHLLVNILEEIRLLRKEFSLLLPQEKLEDYAHPKRIRNSLKRAMKQYPVSRVWK